MSLLSRNQGYAAKPASPVAAIIVFGIIFAISLFFGISGLMGDSRSLDQAFEIGLDKDTVVSGVPSYGAPQPNLDYEHGINSVTIGHEYYYMILDESQDNVLLVRADKDFGKNFDSESFENVKGASVKGKVRTASNDVTAKFSDLTTILNPTLMYIDPTYKSRSIKWFIIAAINLLLIATVAVNCVIKGRNGGSAGVVGGLIGFVDLAGMLVAGYLLIYNILLN